jgi:hypothetical protein
VLLNRFFWTLVAVETAAFVALFASLVRAPSESGGREMGLLYFVLMPFFVVLCAALVYWRASSLIARTLVLVVAASPALFVAVNWGRAFFLERSVRNTDVTAFSDPAQRDVARAIMAGNVAKVTELAGRTKLNVPGVNELTGSDTTLLTLALSQKTPATTEIAVALLKAGADPNETSQKGWTIPLVQAIYPEQRGLVVAALLAAGADPNKKNPNGGVAYHVALTEMNDGNLAILAQMLDHGAKVEAVDGSGRTALMNAAIHGNWKAMDLLLTRGAGRQVKDDKDKTVLDYAQARIGEAERAGGAVDPGLRAVTERLR